LKQDERQILDAAEVAKARQKFFVHPGGLFQD
jgi:hypothetical protein